MTEFTRFSVSDRLGGYPGSVPALVLTLFLVFSPVCCAAADPILTPDTITGVVVGITAGDRVTVWEMDRQYRIRLCGLKTPAPDQPGGEAAKQFTAAFVFNKALTVFIKGPARGEEIPGLIMVRGQSLNHALLDAGHAVPVPGCAVMASDPEDASGSDPRP